MHHAFSLPTSSYEIGDSVTSTSAIAALADFVKATLATSGELGEGLSAEKVELALWQAGCEVLRAVGDSAGADRCVADALEFELFSIETTQLCLRVFRLCSI